MTRVFSTDDFAHWIMFSLNGIGEKTVPHSVLDAIKMGIWDYEPEHTQTGEYDATQAMPGSDEKLNTLARRVQKGLPLWHPSDRRTYDESEPVN